MEGQNLWQRAKTLIPGGNMLLSKRSEMFLPEKWPSYFSKAKGCYVWDLDNNKYKDMSIMGIGTNVLGYGNRKVDNAVRQTLRKGNMSTLNCAEEVYLAERLVSMHPWAGMARFARSGGEANAIAIRIARAFNGKEKIAICGYHGWHDWYLATNLNGTEGLEDHLLPGLEPNGVPKGLKGTTLPFMYNKIEQLKQIFEEHEISAVKMEVQRSEPPLPGYLAEVRRLCNKYNAVLIFDECTSGFRETFGGLHLKYGVNPDLAMYGKALGNGYAITAVLGTTEVMQAVQSTFISSTFWTERIGPSAALATLEEMERFESYKQITETGTSLKKIWVDIFEKYGLEVNIGGLEALATFNFKKIDHLKAKTYITQEMLKKGWLANDKCYVSMAHTRRIINDYSRDFEETISNLTKILETGDISQFLEGPVCHSGFKRLN